MNDIKFSCFSVKPCALCIKECGFINIRTALISVFFVVGLTHETIYQRTSNSRRLFIAKLQNQQN